MLKPEELSKLLPLMEGKLSDVRKRLSNYPDLGRIEIQSIRKVLGFRDEPHKYLTAEQRDQIVELYTSDLGHTTHSLAKMFHITPSGVRNILRRRGVDTTDPNKWTIFREKQLLHLRSQGLSFAKIGAIMNRSASDICQKLKRMQKAGQNENVSM